MSDVRHDDWLVCTCKRDEQADERHVFHLCRDEDWRFCTVSGEIHRCRVCLTAFPYPSIDCFLKTYEEKSDEIR